MFSCDPTFSVHQPKRRVVAGRRAWALVVSVALISTIAAAGGPMVYFPPPPPPLGAPVPPRDGKGAKSAAPAELAAYINESFYAPLSTRLAASSPGGRLSDTLQTRLEVYRATKVALQTELRARIDLLRETDADSRQTGLELFAREQTPRIAALEQAAEILRRDLVTAAGDSAAVPLGRNEADALRIAAFYQPGLSSDQRRLLREASMERDASALESSDGPWFYFSPETSRIRAPADLPPDLASKLGSYQEEKAALKWELCAAVAKSLSPAGLAELTAQQAPRMAALDKLAEEIRRGLILRNDPSRRPDLPALPAELDARIVAYRREKLDLQKALLARVEEVTKNPPTSRHARDKPAAAPEGAAAQQQERIREAIAGYTRDNAARYTALDKSRDSIRSDLARLANTAGPPSSAPSADVLLKKFAESMQQLETWRNYRDYQIAVLQPGLSPEQRRLLFDAGLEKLALPATDGVGATP